jgi:hypothetical protein
MDATLPIAGFGRLVSMPSLALRWSFPGRHGNGVPEATRHQL